MYDVKSSPQRFSYRDERSFRLDFALDDFKERYCSDHQPDGNPFRNSAMFEQDVQDWMQEVNFGDVRKVGT